MQFVEAGALRLDDRLDTVLANFPHASEVTIRQLLTHTTGLVEYSDNMASTGLDETANVRPPQLVALIAGKPLEFVPGTRFEYSNSNYLALGLALEKLAGKPYSAILQERIIEPLRIEVAVSPPSGGDVARGYKEGTPPKAVTAPDASWAYAAGQLFATVGGLVSWDAALFGGRVVQRQSLALMTTPVILPDGTPTNYGFGLNIVVLHGRRIVSHDGGVPGFSAQNFVFPEDDIAIVTLGNTIDFNLALPATQIAETFYPGLGEQLQVFSKDQVSRLDDPQIRARAREWLDRISTASFDTSQLTPEMKSALTAEAVKSPREMLAGAGAIKKVRLAGFQMISGYRVYVYRVTAAKGQFTYTFVLDGKNLIAGLFLKP
jgi:CubicO group peptidase (beta-lactamase class C family)